jgi:hypothetical protein
VSPKEFFVTEDCWKYIVVLLANSETFGSWSLVRDPEIIGGMTLEEIVGYQSLSL